MDLDPSSQDGCRGSTEEPKEEQPTDPTREGSEAVKLLDEELAELEQLMRLQRRKVDALERLRQQWLSGERCVCPGRCPQNAWECGSVFPALLKGVIHSCCSCSFA